MSLKNPKYKIESSFATYEFMHKELPIIEQNFNWEILTKNPKTTVRSYKEYIQHFEGLRLAMLGFHTEIMKQSLFEYKKTIEQNLSLGHVEHLDMLIDFLSLLRNGLMHAYDELIPRWNNEDKKRGERIKKTLLPKGLMLNIPIIQYPGGIEFYEKSKDFYKLNIKVKLGAIVPINEEFRHKMRLVSWHVLTITKKRKPFTLSNYLNHTTKPTTSLQ